MSPVQLPVPPRNVRVSILFIALLLAVVASNCGGGGGGISNGAGQSSSSDFSLGVSPATVYVAAGGNATLSVSTAAIGGTSSEVAVQVSGLPTGVTATPASFTLVSGGSQSITLSAAQNAATTSGTATFTGKSGSVSNGVNAKVFVLSAASGALSTRMKYVRTDAVTEYFTWVNTHWAVYHSSTSRFFVTDPQSNRIFVFDAASESQIATISVPGAFSVDLTPDGNTLYVGTLIGDVYTIDPVGLTVTKRYIASSIGPYGYQALSALPLSDGRVALLGAAGGIPSVDGSAGIAIWNPSDNSATIYDGEGGLDLPFGESWQPLPLSHIGGFATTADRTSVLLGSITDNGALCELNTATGQTAYVASVGVTSRIVTSADGKYIALAVPPNQIVFYDAQTLNVDAEFPVSGDLFAGSGLAFSGDSKTLFVSTDSIVYTYDVSTHQETGWISNIYVPPVSGGFAVGPIGSPAFGPIDGTGLLAGPLEEGFAFLDTTQLQTGPVGTMFTNAYLNPATGPTGGGTAVQWSLPDTVLQAGIYFGKNPAPAIASGGTVTAVTPPGSPGPADVYVSASDGGMQLLPEAFSYGPTILEVTPNVSTADGGGIGIIYGYGFGDTNATTVPPNLTVTVAGSQAKVVGFSPNAYPSISPPYPLQAIYYTIPAESSGLSANVTVGSSSGSSSVAGALTYIPAARLFPIPATLMQGIYDPVRDLYYFTDSNRIQVFSLAEDEWLQPINIPAPSGATQRLWGIALSPDGSKLAVADAQANVIYSIDPSNTSSINTFAFAPSVPPGVVDHPIGVAISNTGMAYVVVYAAGGTGLSSFFELDTNTGALTDYHITGPQYYDQTTGEPLDIYLRTNISSDNSRVFFNSDGYVFNIDTNTGTVFPASTDPDCCYGNYDLTLATNQTQVESTSYLYDSDLNAEATLTLNDREIMNTEYVYGVKFSPDGTLLFQPSINGIDVYDGHLGVLRNRIALPFGLSQNYDALVSDGKDNTLIAITGPTGNGIAVLDLSAINEPSPLPYARSSSKNTQVAATNRRSENRSHSRSAEPSHVSIRAVPYAVHSILHVR